ncbi:MAG: N-formylglutamate amidohydrolase [Nitrospinota bacterium]|nr:N-formylglutamate amidohydrolase [Nitrospinota bacterium]
MKKPPSFLVTCEHAVNRIPAAFIPFADARDKAALNTHAGYDIGAAPIASALARRLNAPFFKGGISRLVVDLNRSETNRKGIFGPIGRRMDAAAREKALERWHRPYHHALRSFVELEMVRRRQVILLSVHSFTPRMSRETRKVDFGLLYDPSSEAERFLCRSMGAILTESFPRARIRMNYPYRGVSDGIASAMRKLFPKIVAVELEFNQGTVGRFHLPLIIDAVFTSVHNDQDVTSPYKSY